MSDLLTHLRLHGHNIKYFGKHGLIKLNTGFIELDNDTNIKIVDKISTSFTSLQVYYTDGTDHVFKIKSAEEVGAIRFDNYDSYYKSKNKSTNKIGILQKCGNYLNTKDPNTGTRGYIIGGDYYDAEFNPLESVYAGYKCRYELYFFEAAQMQSTPDITLVDGKYAAVISLKTRPLPKYSNGVPYLYEDQNGTLYNYAQVCEPWDYTYCLINQYGEITPLRPLNTLAVEIDRHRCHNGFKAHNWPHQIKSAYLLNEHYFTYIDGQLKFLDMRQENAGKHTKVALRAVEEEY